MRNGQRFHSNCHDNILHTEVIIHLPFVEFFILSQMIFFFGYLRSLMRGKKITWNYDNPQAILAR